MHISKCPNCSQSMQCIIGNFYICPHCEKNNIKHNEESHNQPLKELSLKFIHTNGQTYFIDFKDCSGYIWNLNKERAIGLIKALKNKKASDFYDKTYIIDVFIEIDEQDNVVFYSSDKRKKGILPREDVLNAIKEAWKDIYNDNY